MGKFTESLSDTSQQLQQVKQGIRAMQELGQEMLDNTFNVAEAGLRTGYAYAKAEDGETIPQQQKLLQPTSNVLDQELLNREEFWTQKSLKARFGKHYAAYRYLKETHGIRKLPKVSWEAIVNVFNGVETQSSTVEQRVKYLEQIVTQQKEKIDNLEMQNQKFVQQLQALFQLIEQS